MHRPTQQFNAKEIVKIYWGLANRKIACYNVLMFFFKLLSSEVPGDGSCELKHVALYYVSFWNRVSNKTQVLVSVFYFGAYFIQHASRNVAVLPCGLTLVSLEDFLNLLKDVTY